MAMQLRFRVHGLEMGETTGVANVYIIRHAMAYGGDAFRGREAQRASPDVRILQAEARVALDAEQLGLGLHQVRVHLVERVGVTEREVAESAAFFELRLPPPAPSPADEDAAQPVPDQALSQAFDEKLWFADAEAGDEARGEAETEESMWAEYVKLHAQMLDPHTPAEERRLLILDQTAGGLGNRLGSVVSGLLLAWLANRAMLVVWDLGQPAPLLNGDPLKGGIRWQWRSLEDIRAVVGEHGIAGPEYTDMGELAEFLTCSRYTASDRWPGGGMGGAGLAVVTALHIRNPHYYIPLIEANAYYRRRVHGVFGARAAQRLLRRLLTLAPHVQVASSLVSEANVAPRQQELTHPR